MQASAIDMRRHIVEMRVYVPAEDQHLLQHFMEVADILNALTPHTVRRRWCELNNLLMHPATLSGAPELVRGLKSTDVFEEKHGHQQLSAAATMQTVRPTANSSMQIHAEPLAPVPKATLASQSWQSWLQWSEGPPMPQVPAGAPMQELAQSLSPALQSDRTTCGLPNNQCLSHFTQSLSPVILGHNTDPTAVLTPRYSSNEALPPDGMHAGGHGGNSQTFMYAPTSSHAISADLSGGGSKRTLTKEQLARIATNRAEALARKRARLAAGTPSDPPDP